MPKFSGEKNPFRLENLVQYKYLHWTKTGSTDTPRHQYQTQPNMGWNSNMYLYISFPLNANIIYTNDRKFRKYREAKNVLNIYDVIT